ncbi:sulfotransferase family protein [Lentimicrobium sp. S6]|uniref:sulfotransferase family protein n=1 Tax=Lentimicrobium sp. S6 TaxID=2735872 RepID=UPI0015539F1D|nr:sulfotransferase family protein [Lentimicrobium sp. S6]NPD47865.1 sulfotransferase family 2 domain-containing protein [Lentimicrobium sp. S6]
MKTTPKIETRNIKDKVWSEDLTKESKQTQRNWRNFWDENSSVPSAYRYNISICDEPKFIWFRNAKVATRTTFSAIKESNIKLTADAPYKCHYSPMDYKDYFKFGFVRNPWDRFVSGWLNKVIKKNALNLDPDQYAEMKNFDNFVNYCSQFDLDTWNSHFRRQNKLIDLNEVDFIGRFENFEDDLRYVFTKLNLPLNNISKKNSTKHRTEYQRYYSDKSKRMIEELYQKDIQVFGYSF